ncbi:LLM class flavin-dependent oxidoreductase [Streptomyces sp. NPDC002573]|uniref:LLM class flavin-dependent oxidoreductase n=1 Tax=Streptomyces sp. NPDC002573 TaxID=3364651 RepID=UPI00369802AD
MAEFGYVLSCEEHSPAELVEQARMAEQAGFSSLWITDHHHPWNDRQGRSPFVWTVIGALSQAVSLPVETAVTCPLVRTRPAVIAQAAATGAALPGGRFRLRVGTGDGLITMMPDAAMVERFRRGGGGTKPVYGGLKVCWGTDRQEAVRTAHRLWANEQLPGELPQILPTPRHFEQASELVTEERVAASVPCGDDPDAHVEAPAAFVDAGFDAVYVNQIGKDQQGFFDFYRTKVMPRLRD